MSSKFASLSFAYAFALYRSFINWRAAIIFLTMVLVQFQAQAVRKIEGFMPYANLQTGYGLVRSSEYEKSELNLFNYNLGLGALWYFDHVSIESLAGFKLEKIQGTENKKQTKINLKSYYLNLGLSFNLGNNWSAGPLLQSQVSNGVIRYTRIKSESVGQVYWVGLGLNYDITQFFKHSHIRVGLNAYKSISLPSQNAYYGALVVGFAYGQEPKSKVVYKKIYQETLPQHIKDSNFIWRQNNDPDWNFDKYVAIHKSFNERHSKKRKSKNFKMQEPNQAPLHIVLKQKLNSDRSPAAISTRKPSGTKDAVKKTARYLKTESRRGIPVEEPQRNTASFETPKEAIERLRWESASQPLR